MIEPEQSAHAYVCTCGDIIHDYHIRADKPPDDQKVSYKVDRDRIHSADGVWLNEDGLDQ